MFAVIFLLEVDGTSRSREIFSEIFLNIRRLYVYKRRACAVS